MKKTDYQDNPFYYNLIDVPDRYFCDRAKETETISNLLLNGNNIVLKSPRRLGKSSLILHVLRQKPFSDRYNVIFADIYSTRNRSDLTRTFKAAVLGCRTIRNRKRLACAAPAKTTYSTVLKLPVLARLTETREYGAAPSTKEELGAIFEFLESTPRPNIVVFDEFQQTAGYRDEAGNSEAEETEAVIRSHTQRATNTRFIFSGSSRHMLTAMFESPDRPFYNSARPLTLDIIPEGTYADFCTDQFAARGRTLEREAALFVHSLFCGNTCRMQMAMNSLFQNTPRGAAADRTDAERAVKAILTERADDYRVFLRGLKQSQERLLRCIAEQGLAGELTSAAMRTQYGLPAPSTVKGLLDGFTDENRRLVSEIAPGIYALDDTYLELHLADTAGALDSKFAQAHDRYAMQRRLLTSD